MKIQVTNTQSMYRGQIFLVINQYQNGYDVETPLGTRHFNKTELKELNGKIYMIASIDGFVPDGFTLVHKHGAFLEKPAAQVKCDFLNKEEKEEFFDHYTFAKEENWVNNYKVVDVELIG